MLRLTMPRLYMLIGLPPSFALRCEHLVEPWIDPPRVALVDLVARFGIDRCSLDIALRVVVVVAGGRIDAAHRADHLAREENVVDRNHAGEQIDAGLVVN